MSDDWERVREAPAAVATEEWERVSDKPAQAERVETAPQQDEWERTELQPGDRLPANITPVTGVGDAFMRGATADIPRLFTAIPRLSARLGAGIVETAIGMVDEATGKAAGEQLLAIAQYVPQVAATTWLDKNVFVPLQKYWTEGDLGELEAFESKKKFIDKVGVNWLARGVASNLPQLGLSVLSAGAKAAEGVSWLAKATPWAERLALPLAMEAGEAALNMEARERETGKSIGNLRFGVAGFAKGLAAGSLELLSASALLGQIPALRSPSKAVEAGADFLVEGVTEGAQTFIGNFTERMATKPPKNGDELAIMLTSGTFWKEMMEDVPESAVLGSFSGLAMGQTAEAIERLGKTKRPVDERPWALHSKETLLGLPLDPNFAEPKEAEEVKQYLRGQFSNLTEDQFEANWTILDRGMTALANATQKNIKQWYGHVLTEMPGGPPSAMTLFQQAERGELVVTHSLSEGPELDLLEKFAGRVPGMSFAISRPRGQMQESVAASDPFGPITLVLNASTIDPTQSETVVKDRDFWSPTFPEAAAARLGEALTPETLAALYPRQTTVGEEAPVHAKAARSLRSLAEIRAVAKERLSGVSPTEYDNAANHLRLEVAGALDGLVTLDWGALNSDPTKVAVDIADFADMVVESVFAKTAFGTPSRLIVDHTTRDTAARVGVVFDENKRAAVVDAIARYVDGLARLHAPYFEAKRYSPIETRDVAGVIVDTARITNKETLVRVRQMAERFGWEYHEQDTRAKQVGKIYQFADRFFQRSGSVVRGSTDVMPDGRFLITAFSAADPSTMLHEMTHGFRQMLYVAERNAVGDAKGRLGAGLKALEEWAGVKDSNWTEKAEEKFARAMEGYLRSGKAPIPSLTKLFKQFKEWLHAVYDDLKAKKLGRFSPEVEAFVNEFVLNVPPSQTPGLIDKAGRRKEDRKAFELASIIRSLGPQKDLLATQLGELQKLSGLAQEQEQAAQEVAGLKTQEEQAAEGREQARSGVDSSKREIRQALLSMLALYKDKDVVLRLADSLAAVADDAVLDPNVIVTWVTAAWDEAKLHPQSVVFADAFRASALEAIREAKRGMALDALADDLGLHHATAQYQRAVTEAKMVDMRDRAFQVVQLVREIMGTTHPDIRKEVAAIESYVKKFEASPNLLRRYLTVAEKQLSDSAQRLVEAETHYRIVTRTIAARGLPPEKWSPGIYDLTAVDDVALEQIQKQVQADIAAALLELEATRPEAIATNGVIMDIASIMDDLNHKVFESTHLEHKLPPRTITATGQEVARLLRGRPDDAAVKAVARAEGPIKAVQRLWREVAEGIMNFSFEQLDFSVGINPMKFFDPRTYNPNRPMNRIRSLLKKPLQTTTFTVEEMKQVRALFEQASDMPQYYTNIIRPAWFQAMQAALPNLVDRQLVSLVRDFGKADFRQLEAEYARKLQKARADLASAEVGGSPTDIAAMEANVKAAELRLQAVTGHRALHHMPMSPRVAYILKSLEGTFDALFTAAAANHIIGATALLDDFLPRIYARGPKLEQAKKFFKDRLPLNRKNPHSFERIFETLVEAHAWDITPATLDVVELVDAYATSIMTSIAKRSLVMQLMSVAPNAFRVVKVGIEKHPEGYVSLARYVSHALLPQTEEMAKGGELWVEKHIGTLLHNLYEVSAFDKNAALTAVKRVNNWLKRIQLAIDTYHFFQVTRMGLAAGVDVRAASEAMGWLDPTHPKHRLVRELMEVGGLQLSSGDWARRRLHQYIEAEVLRAMPKGTQLYNWLGGHFETFSRMLWETYVPGLKVLVAAKELDRLQRHPKHGELSREELVKTAARFTNDVFGGMAWSLKGRSATTSDLSRLMFLAPDWLETRFRNVLGIFKTGAEGDLWREFWFGRPGSIARNKYEAWVKGQPLGADAAPPRWASGYAWQGLILTATINGLLASLWPDEDDDKPEGMELFTKIVIPMKDKRGYPLKVSLFSTADYVESFLHDAVRITPLVSWWAGRQGPITRATKEVVLGTDYAGRAMRPSAFSLETLGILMDNSLPWMHNIFYGSVTGPAFDARPGFATMRNLTRMAGGHTTSSYPAELMLEIDYYKQQAMTWNGDGMREWNRFIWVPGVREWMRWHARHHNAEVNDMMERMRKDRDLRAAWPRVMSQMRDMYMGMPEARY